VDIVVSIHVPKTAGTLFREVLESLPFDAYYFVYRNHPEAGLKLARRGRSSGSGPSWHGRIKTVLGSKNPFRFRLLVHGHIRARHFTRWVPQHKFIAWLRDPVERVVSHYTYWKRQQLPGDPLWEEFRRHDWTLLEFAQQARYRNVQASYLQGLELEQIGFVGITEHFQRCLPALERVCGAVPTMPAGAPNANPDRKGDRYQLDKRTREAIRELNALDEALYERACAILSLPRDQPT
jgi:hypothetical protein